MKKTFTIFGALIILFSLIPFHFSNAQEVKEINQDLNSVNFFYTETCPHCQDEMKFLDNLQEKFPELEINKYLISDPRTAPILRDFTERYDAKRYTGVVPLTFIGESFLVGYKDDETTGAQILDLIFGENENFIIKEADTCDDEAGIEECVVPIEDLEYVSSATQDDRDKNDYGVINSASSLSFFGLSAEELSLPLLSIILGFLDGFNVCSLGALLLILTLVFALKDRKKVALYGGIFLVITGITYASLIFIWFSIFELLSPYVTLLELIIGLVGIIGGIYFVRQYIRFKKYGPTCDTIDSSWIKMVTEKVQNAFQGQKSIWVMSGAVILFSFAVTVIEFPCSAVIPVAFAGILTSAGVGIWGEIGYLALFMIFYLIDELIIFAIGVYTLKIWVGSSNMTLNLALVQAILFIGLGAFYIGRLLF